MPHAAKAEHSDEAGRGSLRSRKCPAAQGRMSYMRRVSWLGVFDQSVDRVTTCPVLSFLHFPHHNCKLHASHKQPYT
jgi:hypothetical protein